MAIASSLYAGISGLSTMGDAMSVLGDNVANINTTAFKESRSTFQDVLSQSVATASGGAQVGRGVTLNTISSLFAQGSFESSSSPTDMAIGGQGFFMLRAPGSAEAGMFTRAGQFQFNQSGDLVSTTGNFVQGWTVDGTTGQRQGTIGDINIGKNTPPVATTTAEIITNLDSTKPTQASADRLFEDWNGTNAAAQPPADPISATKYDYSTSIKIYDSKGASHDLTAYFSRTTNDNQWQYLITCNPTEDLRAMTTAQKAIYNPDTRYNYEHDKGAGALMYGTIQFDTSGNISQVDAYNVPPDGQVDPAKTDNRMLLNAGDSYFSFPTNFTGSDTNTGIQLNFGARYGGKTSTQRQVLVSDGGARAVGVGGDVSSYITSATPWSKVADANGNTVSQGDTFVFDGYNNTSKPVHLVYTVDPSKDVQDLLDQINTAFGCTASIDATGHLHLADNISGNSSLYVTNFTTISGNSAAPFGGSHGTVPKALSISPGALTSDGTTPVTDSTKSLIGLRGSALPAIAAGDTFTFSGTGPTNNAVAASTFTVSAGPPVSTISDLLNFIDTTFGAGTEAVLDQTGKLRVMDTTGSGQGNLKVNLAYTSTVGGGTANPFGIVDAAPATLLTQKDGVDALINITTSKRMVVSPGRAFSTNTGDTTPITAATQWNSVFDSNSNPLINGGFPRAVSNGDQFVFTGTKRDGSTVTSSFTVAYTKADGTPGTVGDLLSQLSTDFGCQASIDSAGRLTLTDWASDTVSSASALGISSVTYPTDTTGQDIFGPASTAFDFIPADISSEDGSAQGSIVTTGFAPEALSSTQYANSSTTVFQDQNGFASGFLQSVSTDVDGVITGNYSNGQVLKKAQVALANFSNLEGLRKQGGNIFTQTSESGAPVTGAPGTNGLGSISPNSLEQSNVDLGVEFVKLITVQRGFQANSKIITTVDDMLNDLINIKR
ncbi:MAG: flagellar hook-basal body complex protein [Desulfobacteraceae bacterium]|nr:flagellar hook-basal body complex protein [Desulfobacteraceae bacterium]